MMLFALTAAASGLVLHSRVTIPRATEPRMDVVEKFAVTRVVKEVTVFDGGYNAEICEAVVEMAKESIDAKGSFSLAIPGGSVVAALAGLAPDAFDYTKMSVFFINEKIPSLPCITGAKEVLGKVGVPEENLYPVGEGTAAEVAASYPALLQSHSSIDNSGPLPSFDMMLLGTGPDGHCGCLFPDTPEIKATGAGKIMLAGNDERADGDFVAITMDVMCAAKVVIISAAGEGRAPMVAKALSGEFGPFDCPAAMVEAVEETLWYTDEGGISEFETMEDAEEAEVADAD